MTKQDWVNLARELPPRVRRLRSYQRTFGRARGCALMALGARRPGHPVAVSLEGDPRDLWLRLGTSDAEVYDEVVVLGEYDFGVPASARTIVDLGANVGITSAWYAARYPGCRIVAIEPDDENFAALARNAATRPEITPVRAAVWPTSGRLVLANHGIAGWGRRYRSTLDPPAVARPPLGTPATARAVTMSQVMDDHALDWIDLLKVDIEGSERELFEGDVSFLDRVGAIVAELHDRAWPGCARAFFGAVEAFPYELWHGSTVYVSRRPP